MIAFAADTSAMIAVLNDELDVMLYKQAFHDADAVFLSMATLFEAACVVSRRRLDDGQMRLEALIESLSPTIVPFDLDQLAVAKATYIRFGRGTGHPANLYMGDCFAYSLPKTRRLPLLFKGDDFIHTDSQSALKSA